MTPEGHTIRTATASDLPGILVVQRNAFSRVARAFGLAADGLPPLTETLEDLERLAAEGTLFVVALAADGRITGSVRGTPRDDTVEVGRLVVEDGFEGLGLGTALMEALESAFPDAARFELFTGAEAERPLRLYARLGYRIYDRRQVAPGLELVWLEKCRPAR
ncbi:MAG: GNAT family N-acetyltransferase [Coriobacteriaceae bacterium]|nr:GNAT family N-acetyltransferase [Coriobacteriaceae bacterium]